MKRNVGVVVFAVVMGLASFAGATPFTINSTLTGDPRGDNPDNIVLNVTIAGDTTSNLSAWTIDLNSPAHPNAALHEFYFNLVGLFTNYSFSSFNPNTWSVSGGNNAQGSGGADFIFEVDGNTHNVTNAVNLTFNATKLTGNFLVSDFLNAALSCSNNEALGCGQVGAHVGSLSAGPEQSDSGFALGNYSTNPLPPAPIPEPGSLLLTGAGAAWLARTVRRRTRNLNTN
jgi:hypothetical protein